MPDELTHRLWWQLGDYLRAPTMANAMALLGFVHADEDLDYCRRIRNALRSVTAESPSPGLESLYSELTWELMGSVA